MNILTSLIALAGLIGFAQGAVNWNDKNWAMSCDFRDNDMSNARVRGEECGGLCSRTSGCTHFTWTTWNGGTCWMKRGNVSPSDAVVTSDSSSVCGYIQNTPPSNGDTSGELRTGVLATRHGATESGACQLPEGSYASNIFPVALGNIDSLGPLKFQNGMCGHILRVTCPGQSSVDIIVSNSNLGGGLDLYASSWDRATGRKPPGQEWCSVQLTKRNMFASGGPVCHYAPQSEHNNDYFHLLSVFNTGDRVVTSASLGSNQGQKNGNTAYFAFYGGPVGQNEQVSFRFSDGSSQNFRLSECVKETRLKIWS